MECSKVVGVLDQLEFEHLSILMQFLANHNKPAPLCSRVASIWWSLNCVWYSKMSQNSCSVFRCSFICSWNVPLVPVSTKLSSSSSDPLCSPPWESVGNGWRFSRASWSVSIGGWTDWGFGILGMRASCDQKGVVQFYWTWRKKWGDTGCTSCTRCLHMRNWLFTKYGQEQTHHHGSGLYLSSTNSEIGVFAAFFQSCLNAFLQDESSRYQPWLSRAWSNFQ